jgi:heme/copper-type cytochrome/quinol oxidase subunit 3
MFFSVFFTAFFSLRKNINGFPWPPPGRSSLISQEIFFFVILDDARLTL